MLLEFEMKKQKRDSIITQNETASFQSLDEGGVASWCEPNVSSQLRSLCINLATMFGDTNLNQTFTVCGNKKCFVRIEIEEDDE